MRHGLGVVAVALSLTACSSSESSSPAPSPTTTTATSAISQQRAQQILANLPSPQRGSFDGGTFDIGRPIPGPDTILEGRLASMSWDFCYLLDDGTRGSWGGAVKIYDGPETATKAADEFAVFWGCDGARTVIGDIDTAAYDDLQATYCKRAGGDDYLATVSAVEGDVTANLTVSASTAELVRAEIVPAWESLDRTAQEAVKES